MPSAAQSVLWLLSLALERKLPGCRPGPTVLLLDFDLKTSCARRGKQNPRNSATKKGPHKAAQDIKGVILQASAEYRASRQTPGGEPARLLTL